VTTVPAAPAVSDAQAAALEKTMDDIDAILANLDKQLAKD